MDDFFHPLFFYFKFLYYICTVKTNKLLIMMSINQIEKSFNSLNYMYFNGNLPMVTIKYCNSKSYMGMFCTQRNKPHIIKINKHYNISDMDIEDILVHEMIHLWQHINGYKDWHGRSFIKKMNEINSYGKHNVTITDKRRLETTNEIKSKMKSQYILVFESVNTKFRYIARAENVNNLSSMHKILTEYNKFSICKNVNAYEVKHEYVDSMRKSRKNVTTYTIEPEKWDSIRQTIVKEISFIN